VQKVKICVELPESKFKAFSRRAAKDGVSVESLVADAIQLMLDDEDERDQDLLDAAITMT